MNTRAPGGLNKEAGKVRGTLVGHCAVCLVSLSQLPGISVKVRRGPIPWVSVCSACVQHALGEAFEAHDFGRRVHSQYVDRFRVGLSTVRAVQGTYDERAD